ncbi:MAG: TIR domain-containing protein [Mycobacteriales bacterium]
MAYRNKTFVSFASDDIKSYYLMCAWRENKHIEFDFHDAHDLNVALDTSQPDTIRRRLRERLANTKQVVLLVGDDTRAIAARPSRFLHYEVEIIDKLQLPVIFANLNQSRVSNRNRLPTRLLIPYTISVSFGPNIIKYALDEFPEAFRANLKATPPKSGPYYYKPHVYEKLGL